MGQQEKRMTPKTQCAKERHPFAVTGLLLPQLQLLPLNQLQHKNLSQQPLVSTLQTIVLSTWRNFHIQEIAISITSACQQTLRTYSILLLWTAKNTSSILTLIHVDPNLPGNENI